MHCVAYITRSSNALSSTVLKLGRFTSNAVAEDLDVQFRVWAIKSAVKRVPLYVQVRSAHALLRRCLAAAVTPPLGCGVWMESK